MASRDELLGRIGKSVKSMFANSVSSAQDRFQSSVASGQKLRSKTQPVIDQAREKVAGEFMPKLEGTVQGFAQGRTGRAARATGSFLGDTLSQIGSSRAGIAGVAIGAGAVGFGSSIGQPIKDAAFEVAFDDTEADRYFTGRDLDARFFAGSLMGGVGGGLLQATAPGDYMATNPPISSESFTASVIAARTAAGPVTGTMGAAAGAFLGSSLGPGGRKFGKIAGGLIGGFGGANLGIALPALGVGAYLNNNREFFQNSPYSPTRQTQNELNASGDIVLGMHNSRRGY
jgi:hypothetical protein